MIKRTLHFGNPAYLSLSNAQLVVNIPQIGDEKTPPRTIPIEDIGIAILDHKQITVSSGLIEALMENNTALITCDSSHLPTGLLMPLCGNKIQNERFRAQLNASEPLKKQLWSQTISAKIENQANLLKQEGKEANNLLYWAKEVKSGDPDNYEARAAAYYWKNIFPPQLNFTRGREGDTPNNLLNYIYAILRAIVARSLVASGLLPTLGIHHHNRYNAYCLADDIMEPYRPFADKIVLDLIKSGEKFEELSTSIKALLLTIASVDITIDGQSSPLMVGVQHTTASLARCFEGETRKIVFPVFG